MSVFNYEFNNMTQINNDPCALSQRNVQNKVSSDYMVQNFYPACPMSKAIDFAIQQPNVFYNGSHQVGINGCNINTNSDLKLTKITKPPCRINLLERPFLTVPYLGRGPYNCLLESELLQGDNGINKKSANPSSEICYANYKNYPLIPEIQKTVTNPENLIEGAAADGWIRGGLPSREFARDNNCNN